MLHRRHFLKAVPLALPTSRVLKRTGPPEANESPTIPSRSDLPGEFRWWLYHAATNGAATSSHDLRMRFVTRYDLSISDEKACELLRWAHIGKLGLEDLPLRPEQMGPFETSRSPGD